MNEKERILQMIADGKISVDDGEKLLRAVGASSSGKKEETEVTQSQPDKEYTARNAKLVVEVTSAAGESVKFNVPLKLANWISSFIPGDKLAQIEKEGINVQEILDNISEVIDDVTDKDIVNIVSSSGDRIRVYVDQ